MIHLLSKRFTRLNQKEMFVLTDFDRTLTEHDSATSWSMLETTPYFNSNYGYEATHIFEKYRPIELDHKMPFVLKAKHMEDWHLQVGQLLNKYHLYKKTIQKIINTHTGIKLRHDTAPFLQEMYRLQVPVIIVSAGLGDFIEQYLKKEHLWFDNITLHSNFFLYDDDKVIGFKQPLIHSLNKSILTYPELTNRGTGLLFGDQIEDSYMGLGLDTLKVGFCNTDNHDVSSFNGYYDVALTGNSSFEQITKLYIKR